MLQLDSWLRNPCEGALHKAVRGSDPDAALYYLCRMFDAGEDPLYLGRRLVRMAVEDIGLADPQALVVCNAAKDAYDFLGSPEGELAIVHAAADIRAGQSDRMAIREAAEKIRSAGFDRVEYIELRDAESLLPSADVARPRRMLAAVWLDGVRLIDYIPV